jgi:hypothetical protein
MYGGDRPSDEAAMKVENYKLKGLMQLLLVGKETIRYGI